MFPRRSSFDRRALAALLLTTGLMTASPLLARQWRFDVLADGIGVGTYSVTVEQTGDGGVAKSDMKVGVLGIGAYRQHEEETWKGGCLASIASRTEEHGRVTTLAGAQNGKTFRIDGDRPGELQGCVMSFAYWNPDVLKQSHLVNVQTGAWTPVSIRQVGNETMDVGGRSVQAVRHAIETENNTIEVWHSLEGEWLGLKTTTKGGRHVLAYRLRSPPG